jgi:TRAP-type transport system periplasmic protein
MTWRPIHLTWAWVVLLTASMCVHAEAEITLRLAHFLPVVHPMHKDVLVPWAARVSAASGGRLRITVHPAGELGRDPPGQLERVRRGDVDLSWSLPGYTPERFPRTLLAALPGLFSNAEQATEALQRVQQAGDEASIASEYADVKLVAIWVNEPAALFTRGREVRSVEDLAGKTVRHPTVAGRELVMAWGAKPATSRIEVSAQSLREGGIDAAFMDVGAAVAFGIEREATHLLHELPSMTATFFLLMNRARWEALPRDLQQLLDQHGGRALACAGARAYRAQGATALASVRATSVQVGNLSAASRAGFNAAAARVRRESSAQLRAKNINAEAIIAALETARGVERPCQD